MSTPVEICFPVSSLLALLSRHIPWLHVLSSPSRLQWKVPSPQPAVPLILHCCVPPPRDLRLGCLGRSGPKTCCWTTSSSQSLSFRWLSRSPSSTRPLWDLGDVVSPAVPRRYRMLAPASAPGGCTCRALSPLSRLTNIHSQH